MLAFWLAAALALASDLPASRTADDDPSYDGSWSHFPPAPTGEGLFDPELDQVTDLVAFGSNLVAAGDFSEAGEVPVANIAIWDGSAWAPLGAGFDAAPTCLAVHEGVLYAAGYFTASGTTPLAHVARWDGLEWQALGSGLDDFAEAMTVHDGRLIVAGKFLTAGGAPAARLAAWDGAAWSALGSFDGRVGALLSAGGRLYAGGMFTEVDGMPARRLASWDGVQWSEVGGGTDGRIRAVTWFDDQLVVGGAFAEAGGVAASNVASWNGAFWVPLGSGLDDEVFALAPYRRTLVVGGDFLHAGDDPVTRIARWNGTNWGELRNSEDDGVDETGQALLQLHGRLWVGGRFANAGGSASRSIAAWEDDPAIPLTYTVHLDRTGDFPDLQSTIDAASRAVYDQGGDRIEVGAGTYPEDIVIQDKPLALLALEGADATALTSVAWSLARDDGAIEGFTILGPSSFAPTFVSFEIADCRFTETVEVDGVARMETLSITDSALLQDGDIRYSGSGVVLRLERCRTHGELFLGTNANLVLRDSKIEGWTRLSGGDTHVVEGNAFGGGASLELASASYTTVRSNRMVDCVGGIEFDGDDLVLEDNVLLRCGAGIAILSDDSWGLVLRGNTVVDCPFGIRAEQARPGDVFAQNLVAQCGRGMEITPSHPGSPPEVACNDVWASTEGNWFGLPDPTGVDGNISLDPHFCNPSFDDLALAADSPCAPEQQPDCGRIGACDVGCGEIAALPADPAEEAAALRLVSPSPLTAGAAIRFLLPRAGATRLDLIDVRGRLIATALSAPRSAGEQMLRWNGRGLTGAQVRAGVYFWRLCSGDETVVQKVVIAPGS